MDIIYNLWANANYDFWWFLREALFLVAVCLTCVSTYLRGKLDLRGWYFQWASIFFWVIANIIWQSPVNLVFNGILLYLGITGYQNWKKVLPSLEKRGENGTD